MIILIIKLITIYKHIHGEIFPIFYGNSDSPKAVSTDYVICFMARNILMDVMISNGSVTVAPSLNRSEIEIR